MPAQINATIIQNMSDRQPDIDSMILSMIFIGGIKKVCYFDITHLIKFNN